MSAPDPEGMSLLAKLMAAGAAVVYPLWKSYDWLQGKFSKKADKDEVANCLRHIEELYKNAEKDRAVTRDLCEGVADKLQQRMDENHRHIVGLILGNRNAP